MADVHIPAHLRSLAAKLGIRTWLGQQNLEPYFKALLGAWQGLLDVAGAEDGPPWGELSYWAGKLLEKADVLYGYLEAQDLETELSEQDWKDVHRVAALLVVERFAKAVAAGTVQAPSE